MMKKIDRIRFRRIDTICAANGNGFACFMILLLSIGTPAFAGENGAASGDSGRVTTTARKPHPLQNALEVARASRDELKKAKDYTAVFNKREIVRGKVIRHSMQIKNRAKPFSVYLKFRNPHDGREVVYVEGRNEGKLLAHETGLLGLIGTVSLLPTSSNAMSESQYPITAIGLWKLLDKIIEQWEYESQFGEVDVKNYPNAKVGNVECTVIESVHPQPRREFKFHRTRLYIDNKTKLPFRVEQYGFPRGRSSRPPLIERYEYSRVQTNVGLKDLDFDTRNPRYDF